jgi:hypothetical protein
MAHPPSKARFWLGRLRAGGEDAFTPSEPPRHAAVKADASSPMRRRRKFQAGKLGAKEPMSGWAVGEPNAIA